MEKKSYIKIKGARVHNLKNVDINVPRNQMVVITGLSGSGKSSLAFDTIYADGQRRYMESLSSYARMFLGQMDKPEVESIEGLSPAISIAQKSTNRNPRSTVGTITEIYDYLRLLYARIGIPHCPKCGRVIKKQSVDQMIDAIMDLPEGTRFQLLAPIIRGKKGRHEKILEQARKSGFVRVIINGSLRELNESIELDKNSRHNISIVLDRLVVKAGIESRLTDSIEHAMKLSEGMAVVDVADGESFTLSANYACPECGISLDEIEPRSFSFNNPFGACPECSGLGYKMEFDEELMIPDKSLSIDEGAIVVPGWQSSKEEGSFTRAILKALSERFHFKLNVPFESYTKEVHDIMLYGTEEKVNVYYKGKRGEGTYPIAFEGLIKNAERRYRDGAEVVRTEYETYMKITPCKSCGGQRLKRETLAVTVADRNIYEITDFSIQEFYDFFKNIMLTAFQQSIAEQILKEIKARAKFLLDVGLKYLTLARGTSTLSGGEAQRIRLATQIGSGLVGITYILDEPSIGLHQRDNAKLLNTLFHLRNLENTVIVVEHDEDTIRAADYVIDIGPGAGEHGGEIIAAGTAEELINNKNSITGAYLSGKLSIPVPDTRRNPKGFLWVYGARENNLKNIDVRFPLGVVTCITGVSGSGKSTLVNEILYKTLARNLNRARCIPGKCDKIEGMDQLNKVISVDQAP